MKSSAPRSHGRAASDDQHSVFFSQLKSPDGPVEHTSDNPAGRGDGDKSIPTAQSQSASRRRQDRLPGLNPYGAERSQSIRPGQRRPEPGRRTRAHLL
ncbi:TerD family protein [Streptomyces chartreusis]